MIKEKFGKREVLMLRNAEDKIGLMDSNKPTCSLLIAVWILCRFGVYEIQKARKLSDKGFESNNLITILPEKYQSSENKAPSIIEITKYSNLLNKVEYKYF